VLPFPRIEFIEGRCADIASDGVKATFPDEHGATTTEIVSVIDWTDPEANDFFLASQLWVHGGS
jgi:type I restriction enzyme R subunit